MFAPPTANADSAKKMATSVAIFLALYSLEVEPRHGWAGGYSLPTPAAAGTVVAILLVVPTE